MPSISQLKAIRSFERRFKTRTPDGLMPKHSTSHILLEELKEQHASSIINLLDTVEEQNDDRLVTAIYQSDDKSAVSSII